MAKIITLGNVAVLEHDFCESINIKNTSEKQINIKKEVVRKKGGWLSEFVLAEKLTKKLRFK